MSSAMISSNETVRNTDNLLQCERQKRSMLMALCIALLLFGGVIWTLIKAFSSTVPEEVECYTALSFQGLYFAIAILIRHLRRPVYIFEPYTMVTLIYVLVYHVAAVFQFSAGDTSRYGIDAMPQTLEAVFFVVAGHIAFTLAYGFDPIRNAKKDRIPFYCEPKNKLLLVRAAYCIFFVSLCLYLVYAISCGFSLSYILSGGLSGNQSAVIEESALGFLSYTSYSCVGAWAVIFAFGRGRFLKTATFAVMIAILFFSGTRAAIILPLLAPIVITYVQKKKAPSLVAFAGVAALLVFLFAIMQVARVGIRTGVGMDLGTGGLANLFEPFYAEIDDFKVFYSLLPLFPNRISFLYGSQMIVGSLVVLIPRAIWPGKPDPQVHEIINILYGNRAMLNGVAYPNLGEYYVEFGVIGIIVCMFILGLLCQYARNLYMKRQGLSLSLVLYSLIYGALFQIIIRGYMPQNFTMMLFLLAPVVIIAVLNKRTLQKLDR